MTFTPTCSGIDEQWIGCLSSHSFLDKGCLFSTIHVDSHKCEILSMRPLDLLLWFSKYWRSSIHNCEYEWIEDYFVYRMQYKSKLFIVYVWRKRQGSDETLLKRPWFSGWLHVLLLPSWVLSSPNHTIPLPGYQRRVGLFLMYEPAFLSCKECLWTPMHPPCAHFPNPLLYCCTISVSISIMDTMKNGMQHNLLLESGIQFVHCFPFTALECIQPTIGEGWIDIHVALPRNCLYSSIQRSPAEEHRVSLSYSPLQSEYWCGLWKCLPCICGVWFWRLQHSHRFPSRNHEAGVNLHPSRWDGGWCEADLSNASQYPSFSLLSLRTAWSH